MVEMDRMTEDEEDDYYPPFNTDDEDDPFIPIENRKDEVPEINDLCKLITSRVKFDDTKRHLEENTACLDQINHCFKKWTPLLYATATNRLDVCQLLVRNGADINFVPPDIPVIVDDMDARLGHSQLSAFMMSCYRCVSFEIFDLFFQSQQSNENKVVMNSSTPRDG